MDDSDYLQRMSYYEGEFLLAQDFTLEQTYFLNQFKTLFSYYFTPGIAGAPQKEIPPIVYKLFREQTALESMEVTEQPVSFYLSLVSSGQPPASQDSNYISVGKGLAIDPLANQITIFEGDVVDKSYFATITGPKAYLTIAYGEAASATYPKVTVQRPVFSAVETTSAFNSTNRNALYLATVTLTSGAITGLEIEQSLRQYSRPYATSGALGRNATSRASSVDASEIAELKKRIAQLESAVNRKEVRKPQASASSGSSHNTK